MRSFTEAAAPLMVTVARKLLQAGADPNAQDGKSFKLMFSGRVSPDLIFVYVVAAYNSWEG